MADENQGGDNQDGGREKSGTKKYKVQTPIRVSPEETIKEGEILKLSKADATELLSVGAIAEA